MWDSLTSQLSIEASVRLLELRQDGGEEQTHRCRRRSSSPRLKRGKGRTCVSHPLKPNRNAKLRHFQSRQGLKLPKQWERRSWSQRRPLTQLCLATESQDCEQQRIFNLPLVRNSCERRHMSSSRSIGDENGKNI